MSHATEHHIDQGAITIDRAVEVVRMAVGANIRLVQVPATTDFDLSALAELLRQ
jgi:hypothetical protein